MTVVLMGAAALLAAAGTRLAAVPLAAAAVVAGLDPPYGAPATGEMSLVAPAVWVSALAAGWLLLTPIQPRRLALPILGGAAALAVGGVPNGAAVLGLWVTASAAALGAARTAGRWSAPARRWALGVWAGDVLVVAAVAIALLEGFEGWPITLGLFGSAALLAAVVLRMFSAAGPEDGRSETGMVALRAQAIIGMVLLGVAAPDDVLRAGLVVFAASLVIGGHLRRRPQTDAVQELSLVGMAVVSASLGWATGGWVWGALAGGTLIHYLRFISGRDLPGRLAAAVCYGGGLGLPLLPVVMALLEGSVAARDELGLVVMFALAAGLAGRARRAGPLPRRAVTGPLGLTRGAVVASGAVAVGLWAGLVTLPAWAETQAVAWPWPWAGAAVVAAGLLGSQAAGLVPSASRARPPVKPPGLEAALRTADRLASSRLLATGFAVAVLAALLAWALGLARGFL